MMKKYVLCFILTFVVPYSISVTHAQSVQKGKVVLMNSGKKTLSGVQILVWGAQPTDTDQSGFFQLNFEKALPGDPISLKDAYKKGYEIVNDKELKEWVIASEKKMVIVMSLAGTVKAMKEKYYNIGNELYLKRYQATLIELEKQKDESLFTEKIYEEKLEDAYKELNLSQQLLSEYATTFASINKDDLSSLEKKAFLLLDEGKVDDAIALYENEKLLEQLNKQLDIREKTKSDLENMVASLRRYAEICAFAGGKENLEKAEQTYCSIALSDAAQFENIMEYALFLHNLNHYQDALNWLNKSMICANTKLEIATVFFLRGEVHYALQNFDEARKCYSKGYTILKDIELSGSYKKLLIRLLVRQSHIELEKRMYIDALNLLAKAEAENKYSQGYDSLLYVSSKADISGSRALIAQTKMLFNRLAVDKKQNIIDTVALEKTLLSTISDYEYLVSVDSMQYVASLVNTYSDLGSFYQQTGNYVLAEKYYLQTLPMRETDYRKNPDLGQIELATLYSNIGTLYDEILKTTESDTLSAKAMEYYNKALALRETMAHQNPKAFSESLAIGYHDISVAYMQRNQKKQYIEYVFKSIQVYEKILKQEPTVYGDDLAIAYFGLAKEYEDQNMYTLALEYYNKAIDLIDTYQLTSIEGVRHTLIYNKLMCYGLSDDVRYEDFMKECQKKHGVDSFSNYTLALYYYHTVLQGHKSGIESKDLKMSQLFSLSVKHYAAAIEEGHKITNEADVLRANYDMLIYFMLINDDKNAFIAYRNMNTYSADLTKKDYQENEILCEIYGMGAYWIAYLYLNMENWKEAYNFFAKASEILVCRPEEKFQSKLVESQEIMKKLAYIINQ